MKGAHSATAIHWFAGAWLALVSAFALANPAEMQDWAAAVARRHPPESLTTVAAAETALADVSATRLQVEWAAYDGNVMCAQRFFRAACEAEVRQIKRAALESLRLVEIDAERFIRRTRDQAREVRRQEALREADDTSARLAAQQTQAQADYARRQEKAEGATAPTPPPHGERPAAPPHAPSVTAEQAAERVEALERKRLDAAQRRQEAQKRQAERAARQGNASGTSTTP